MELVFNQSLDHQRFMYPVSKEHKQTWFTSKQSNTAKPQ